MSEPSAEDLGPEREGPSPYPEEFLLAFDEAVRRLGWQVRRWEGGGVECLDETGKECTFGLANVYRLLRGVEESQWPAFLAGHLRRVRAALGEATEDGGLHELADRLMARIGPPFNLGAEGKGPWSQPLDDTGLVVNLVIDCTETMRYVTGEMVRESGRPGSAWLDIALENLRGRTSPDQLEMVEEVGVLLCTTGDAYDAARALVVEYLLPEYAERGYLLSIPNRDRLLLLPVEAEALARLHILQFAARQSHAEAPYPISDEVFWVRDGVWRRFGIEFKDGTLSVTPPPEFAEVLEELLPDEEEEDGAEQ
jgi:hypothetical protein